ncbi:MAG: hypothetical protein ACEPO8_10845 [Rhodothermaceae bacterium]
MKKILFMLVLVSLTFAQGFIDEDARFTSFRSPDGFIASYNGYARFECAGLIETSAAGIRESVVYIAISGPSSFRWKSYGEGGFASVSGTANLLPGFYKVTVNGHYEDHNGETHWLEGETRTFSVTPENLSFAYDLGNVTEYVYGAKTLSVGVKGGTPGYTFEWTITKNGVKTTKTTSNGSSSTHQINLDFGDTYTVAVKVTDSDGKSVTTSGTYLGGQIVGTN